jgi:heme/copper-type cytochrome/quinol oxidase subunit 4
MAEQRAGMTAAILVLMAVFGLIVIIGVVLGLMWIHTGIQHSPS